MCIRDSDRGGGNQLEESVQKLSVDKNSILYLSEETSEVNNYYRLSFGRATAEEIIKALEYSVLCNKLAKELAVSALSKDGINIRKPTFTRYQIPLKEKVFEMNKPKEAKFRESFLNGDEPLTAEDRKFRSIFLKEVRKIVKEAAEWSEEQLKLMLRNRNIKISEKFWKCDNEGKSEERKLLLPSDSLDVNDIRDFLSRLKIFLNQPDETMLRDVIKQKIQVAYKVAGQDVGEVFACLKDNVETWWKPEDENEENEYLTEKHKLFEVLARFSVWFDVRKPVATFTGRKQELDNLHSRIQLSLIHI